MFGIIVFGSLALIAFIVTSILYKGYVKQNTRNQYDDEVRMMGLLRKIVPTVFGILCVVCLIFSSVRIIDSNEVGVVRTFGKVTGTLDSGLNFTNPFTQTVKIIDTRTHVSSADFASYTKDAQSITATVEYQYEVRKEAAEDIILTYGSYDIMETKMQKPVEEKSKSVLAKYGAMKLLEIRADLSTEIAMEVAELEERFPVHFTSVVISNLDFSDSFEASVEQKMTAEQDALRAEQEKKKAVIQAEQAREVAAIEAEAAVTKAKGEAEAMKITKEALSAMPDEYIQSMYLEKWDGHLPQIVSEGSNLMLTPNMG